MKKIHSRMLSVAFTALVAFASSYTFAAPCPPGQVLDINGECTPVFN